MSDVDTMRWGDTVSMRIATAVESIQSSSQILNAHWQRPCVWRLMLSVEPSIGADDSGVTFTVIVYLRVGVGQANQRIPLATIPFATPFAPVVQFFDIPAQDVQLQFQLAAVGVVTDTQDFVTCSAFIAPHAEPGGIVQIRDGMAGGIREPDRDGLPRWMPPGFEDGETRYR